MFSHLQGLQSRFVPEKLPRPINIGLTLNWTKVLSGAAPFSDKSPYKAMQGIVQGERPPRPIHPGLTEGLWELIQQCWGPTVQQRPRALRISCHL